MRSVRSAGAGARACVLLVFEHQTVGHLELAVPAGDDRAHQAVRDLRSDAGGFARLFALLACAIELDGKRGRFTYEAIHRLTHGPTTPGINRVRLNAPIEGLLHLFSVAAITWRPPSTKTNSPAGNAKLGPLLVVDVINRKARTVSITPAARPLLLHYSLAVAPSAFHIGRPANGRSRPPAPVLARLRLGALIAARWRGARRGAAAQRVSFADLLTRFAWVALDAGAQDDQKGGSSEAAGRALRPRLREAAAALAADLSDPTRYGAGLREPLELTTRAPLRCLLALGLAEVSADAPAATQSPSVVQPTLDEARLRDATAPAVFACSRPEQQGPQPRGSRVDGQDDWRVDGQESEREPAIRAAAGDAASSAHTVAVAVTALGDGRVVLEFANGLGVLLPADVAEAANLRVSLADGQLDGLSGRSDWRAHGQESKADWRGSPPDWRESPPDSQVHGQDQQSETPAGTGISASDHSDDLDRARGARLSAALAPPPTTDPAPHHHKPRRTTRAKTDPSDHRRTA
jgi:hypothetical protein